MLRFPLKHPLTIVLLPQRRIQGRRKRGAA